MKKVIIPLMLLLGTFYFSQTATKKYNSFQNRYEYFDSGGNMIGYEKYNNLSEQWEYYTTGNTSQTRQPTQYRDPAKVDMSSTINAASVLQNRYDNNVQKLQSVINNISNQINNLDVDDEQKQVISNNFQKQCVNELNQKNINYSSANETNRAIQWLYDSLNIIIKNTTSSTNSKKSISDNFLNLYDKKFRDLDSPAKINYDKISHTFIASKISEEYKKDLDTFYSLAKKFELNETNSKELYHKVLYSVIILNNLANSYYDVKRMTHFNSKNSVVEDANNLNSYIMIDDKFIHFKTATNDELHRDLLDKKYNSKKSGYEYKSQWGSTFVSKDLSYVKFYESNDFTGDYYIYYISK